MYIKTKEFQLSKNEFFKIILINQLKRRNTVIQAIVLFLIMFAITRSISWGLSVMFIYLVLLLIYLPIYNWQYVRSKANVIFLKRRHFEIDDNFITGYLKDGSFDKIKFDNIIYVKKTSKYYLLYLSKMQFVYLPLDTFFSREDIDKFHSLLKGKGLIK